MIVRFFLFATLLLVNTFVFSQERKVLGRIMNAETQRPIADASVTISGEGTTQTFSNHLGYFELTVNPAKHNVLTVSHVGFKIVQVDVPSGDRIQIILEKEYLTLDQLDMIGTPKESQLNISIPVQLSHQGADSAIQTGAIFPGGLAEFYKLIAIPLSANVPSSQQRFNIKFTINESGLPVNISVPDAKATLTEIVEKAFNGLPGWIPATQRKKNVSQHFLLPVITRERPDPATIALPGFYEFIRENIKYPVLARRMGVEGAVYVKFVLNENGNPTSILLLRDIGADCGTEVKRVIAGMPLPTMKTIASQTGEREFILPVVFALNKAAKFKPLDHDPNVFKLKEVVINAGALVIQKREIGGSVYSNRSQLQKPVEVTHSSLQEALVKPKEATRLSLREKGLDSIPRELFRLKNLKFLDLEKNALRMLPSEISSLEKLEVLYLYSNQISIVPESIASLKKLKTLGLGSNMLSSIPAGILALDELEGLDVTNNKLTSLPEEISILQNLRVLGISDNNISSLPEGLFRLNKLEKIHLQNNPIAPADIDRLKKRFPKAEIVFFLARCCSDLASQ